MKTNLITLSFCLLFSFNLHSSINRKSSEDRGAAMKGSSFLQIGVGTNPLSANSSYHFFILNHLSLGGGLSYGLIQATETYQGALYKETRPLEEEFIQLNLRSNFHFFKHRTFDPYIGLGLNYCDNYKKYHYFDVESGYSFGQKSYLSKSDNYLLPFSFGIGYRYHGQVVSGFMEFIMGEPLLKAGLAIRL